MRHLLYIIPTLIVLWMFDNTASIDRYGGWERNSVRNSMHRWHRSPKAKVAILGSSTSKDWLPRPLASKVTGVGVNDVLDAHINGCHQGCTWAEVRKMMQRKRRFEVAFYGTNLFQMCEERHSKRVLQQQMMLPAADAPRLFALYGHAEQPLTYMGRYVGMTLSGAYGDTAAVQRYLVEDLFGKPKRGRTHRWAREALPAADKTASCRYRPEDVAFKAAVSGALLDDLSAIADHVFLLLLPDPTAGSDDPEHRRRWAAHRALQEALAAERPQVTLIDLVTDGVTDAADFRDAIHLHERAKGKQQQLFEARMKALGWPRPKTRGKSRGKAAKKAPEDAAPTAEPAKPSTEPKDEPAKPSTDLPGESSKPSPKPSKPSPKPSKPSPKPSKPSPKPSEPSAAPGEAR